MKVNLFNHWFKYKVPVDDHLDVIKDAVLKDKRHYLRFWGWLDDEHDVGQYYKVSEGRNYMVFHNRAHYIMFLLKL